MTAHDHAKHMPAQAPPGRSQGSDHVAAFLEEAVSGGASSLEVADVIVKAFRGIGQVLVPIIGQRGLAALYRRSLHLAGPTFAEVIATTEAVPMAMDFALLEAELGKQTAEEAAAAGAALLQVFNVLLTSLIGQSLTERLLRSVWANFLSGPSARDTKP